MRINKDPAARTVLTLTMLCIATAIRAQVALKTNLLYDAALTPNDVKTLYKRFMPPPITIFLR